MVDFNTRCPSDKNAPKFLQQPGDLHKFFLNLMVKALERSYTPAILSAPAIFFQNEIHNNATLASIQMAENVIRDGPWIVTLDDIFSEVECDRLIELGALRGYSRSTDVGELKPDGTIGEYLNPRRTSTNAWCVDDCYDDEQVQVMHARIEELTGIPNNHSEYWQLLKYEKTQEYMQHHDYIEEPFERAPGVRILTIFLYLNNVEAGGGTHFNILNITVTPKRGQVVIWPSVLDESPDEKDSRTDHQALPIEEGIKYGANAWVHQRDFKTPMIFNCA
jgi:prolyl 4-hydroxylase